MKRKEFAKLLEAAKALNLPPATPDDVMLAVKPKGFEQVDPEYFKEFVGKQKDLSSGQQVCVCCRKALRITWGIAHGVAHCIACGWPSRVYHYDLKNAAGEVVVRMLDYALEVHPAGIELKKDEEQA